MRKITVTRGKNRIVYVFLVKLPMTSSYQYTSTLIARFTDKFRIYFAYLRFISYQTNYGIPFWLVSLDFLYVMFMKKNPWRHKNHPIFQPITVEWVGA